MAIKRYIIDVYATIKDIETSKKKETQACRTIATMYEKGSLLFKDLVECVVEEELEEIDECLLDIEEITSHTYNVREV